jgi:hypothetical protein
MVQALQALRGVGLVAAATLVAELGDITRFTNPRQLMAYLGLVPSEHSSGRTRRQGGITKAGNGTARRMLIEAAWSYRFPARISREQLLRQEQLSRPIRDIAWKAQERLCRRYRTLARTAKLPTVITAAIAPVGGLRLGDRQTGAALDALKGRDWYRKRRLRTTPYATTHPMLGKAGGTITARRTLADTISRISSDAGN